MEIWGYTKDKYLTACLTVGRDNPPSKMAGRMNMINPVYQIHSSKPE
jgi:hypothetical protein